MKKKTQTAFAAAREILVDAINKVDADTVDLIERNEIHPIVEHLIALREEKARLALLTSQINEKVERLERVTIPDYFLQHRIKSENIIGIGRVTVKTNWKASMIDKMRAFAWLRSTGNQGLIIETVNAQTLAAFAKGEAKAKRALPADVFNVSTYNNVSIVKSGVADAEEEAA